jgi:hypothetical protein
MNRGERPPTHPPPTYAAGELVTPKYDGLPVFARAALGPGDRQKVLTRPQYSRSLQTLRFTHLRAFEDHRPCNTRTCGTVTGDLQHSRKPS